MYINARVTAAVGRLFHLNGDRAANRRYAAPVCLQEMAARRHMRSASHGSRLFVLSGLAVLSLAAQSSTSDRLHRVSPATAPERIVYEVFTAEILAHERHSNDPSLTADRRKEIGRRLQTRIGLNDTDYAMLEEIATRLHAELDANATRGDAVMKNPDLTTAQRTDSIASLRDARNGALDNAIREWRTWMGMRFRWADDRIRAHVAPGIRVGNEPDAVPGQGRGAPR